MDIKKVLVSDGSGKFQEAPSSSFSVDGGKLIIKNANVTTASYTGGLTGSIMQVSGGMMVPIWTTSSIPNYYNPEEAIPNNLSGTLFQLRTDAAAGDYRGIGPHRIGSASFSGDVVGTTGSARVVSVVNVESGTLDSRFGGTSGNNFNAGSLVTLSGSGLKPTDGTNKVVVTNASGDWSYADTNSIEAIDQYLTGTVVYLYTGSIGTSNTFTWIKPGSPDSPISAKPRFIRVICQGGGGGGGGPWNGDTTGYGGGGGGGGGGYCDIIFNSENIVNTISVTAGAGGNGSTGFNTRGGNGGSSSFGTYVYSNGGEGGVRNNDTSSIPAYGGAGYNYSGGNSGLFSTGWSTSHPSNGASVFLGGAGGGRGGYNSGNGYFGGVIQSLNIQPGTYGLGATYPGPAGDAQPPSSGSLFNFNKISINDSLFIFKIPNLIWAGGSGGGSSTRSTAPNQGDSGNGSSPEFGSGGGGAGEGVNSQGGNGGKGYVLIICT